TKEEDDGGKSDTHSEEDGGSDGGEFDTPQEEEEDEELIEGGKEIYFDNKDIDAHYTNERTEQRDDLKEQIEGQAKDIRDYTNLIKAVRDLETSDEALDRIIDLFNSSKMLGIILKKISEDWNILKKAPVREKVIAAIDNLLKSAIEKSKLEEMPIDEQGNVNEEQLKSRLVQYDETKEEQDKTQVTVSSTLNRSPQHDTPSAPVDTTNSVTHQKGKGWEIFVMSPTGDLHMASHKIGKYHHSSLLAGAATAAAGSIKASGGKIEEMNDKSGHYKPGPAQMKQVLHRLQKGGINLDFKLDLGSVQTTYNKASELFGDESGLQTFGSELGAINRSEAKTRLVKVRDILKKFIDVKGEASVKEVFTSIGWKYEIGQFGIVIRGANGVLATEQEVLEKLNQKFDTNQEEEGKEDTKEEDDGGKSDTHSEEDENKEDTKEED
ncbi:hypothetical protein V2H45_21920, partial [Tumidithrix elongata RA019]|nr:hypothetical protein [Tumidithrix elongata RA019]